MASLTGRTWLDCNNPKLADDFFNLAVTVSVILEVMCTNSEHYDVVMFV